MQYCIYCTQYTLDIYIALLPLQPNVNFSILWLTVTPSTTPLVISSQQYFNVTSERYLCCSILLLMSPIASLSCTYVYVVQWYTVIGHSTFYTSHGWLTISTNCTLFSDNLRRDVAMLSNLTKEWLGICKTLKQPTVHIRPVGIRVKWLPLTSTLTGIPYA